MKVRSLRISNIRCFEDTLENGVRVGNRGNLHYKPLARIDVKSFLTLTTITLNNRILRGVGIAIRNTADLIIGTFCIERGHTLLHDDRDFDPMEKHLGLKLA